MTGAVILGASAVAGGVAWWYRAQHTRDGRMEPGAPAAGEFPNALRLPGSSGVLGVLDVSAPLIIAAKSVQHAILEGDTVTLQSLAFDPMHAEGSMAHMAMGEGAKDEKGGAPDPHAGMAMGGPAAGAPAAAPHGAMLADGAAIDLLRINVTTKTAYEQRVPPALSTLPPIKAADPRPREFLLDLKDSRWRINGETFEMKKTPVTVQRGAKEIWEIRDDKASMPHPMHLHGVPFRVLSRSGSPQQVAPGAVNEQGLTATDLGWKDTVLLWPGETARLAVDFSHPYPGDQMYLFHCHNLEHEDQGMMINIKAEG